MEEQLKKENESLKAQVKQLQDQINSQNDKSHLRSIRQQAFQSAKNRKQTASNSELVKEAEIEVKFITG